MNRLKKVRQFAVDCVELPIILSIYAICLMFIFFVPIAKDDTKTGCGY